MDRHQLSLRVLLFQENGAWVAQALELDLCAQGTSIQSAKDAFVAHLDGQIRTDKELGLEPLAGIDPAPAAFVRRWEKAHALAERLHAKATEAPLDAELRIAA